MSKALFRGAAALLAAAALLLVVDVGGRAFTVASPLRGLPVAGQQQPQQPEAAPRAAGGSYATAAGASALATVAAVVALRKRGARQVPRITRQALTEVGRVKLNLMAGKATPAPPVGPALGEFGANIAFFVKEYNALTADKAGELIPVIVKVMSDRSFQLELKAPPTAALLHKAVGKDRGSGQAQDIIGTITIDQLREIAELKLQDLPITDITRAMKIVHGTAVASGIKVEGYEEWLAKQFKKPKSIMERYGTTEDFLPKSPGEEEEAPAEEAPAEAPVEA